MIALIFYCWYNNNFLNYKYLPELMNYFLTKNCIHSKKYNTFNKYFKFMHLFDCTTNSP